MKQVWEILNPFLLNSHSKKKKKSTQIESANLPMSSQMEKYTPLISLPIKPEGGAKLNEI